MLKEEEGRTCALWLCITQGGMETWYKVKTVRNSTLFRVRRTLFKYIEGTPTATKYDVDEPFAGRCTCTCPDWQKHQRDCKHILALRKNDLLGGMPTGGVG